MHLDVRSLLAQTQLFVALSGPALDQLAASTRIRSLTSGETLFGIGSASGHLYIVAVGRLRVARADGTLISDVGRLEPVGEISLISGEPRTAMVYAVRDSKVLEIDRETLYAVFAQHPSALLAISRTTIARLRQAQRAAKLEAWRHTRCFALLPATPALDLTAFCGQLEQALESCGSVEVVDARRVDAALGPGAANAPLGGGDKEERLIHWLQELELSNRHLLYLGGHAPDQWSQRCMRQADRILVLAQSRDVPADTPMIRTLRQSGTRARVDLVLQRDDIGGAGPVLEWRELTGAGAHYFVRPRNQRDVARVARSLTGRAVGLVLGGGGARGFAHLGLVRAIEDMGIDIDVVGGTSMGAFMCALLACGYTAAEMKHLARECFVRRNLLNDFLFPTVALIRGRKFLRHLQELFGERRIEDLRTPFFCVSTNLTRGCVQVHDRGPLGMWLGTSMCIPGVAPPVAWRGDLLVDGAVVNSLPTDIMQGLERGPIIASDVSTEGGIAAPGIEGPDPEALLRADMVDKRPNLFSILFRTATLTSESGVAARADRANLYLRMPVGGVGVFDWKRIDDIAERGYLHAMELLPAFKLELGGEAPSRTGLSPAAAAR